MGKTYACSDLHGRYDLFQQIKEYLEPEDVCYVLGDCGDRGPNGWKIIKEVYENPQFIYIKGNHEDMLVKAMRGKKGPCFSNGGMFTYDDWELDGADRNWIKKLTNLPFRLVYVNKQGKRIILTHAGYTPHTGLSFEFDLIWGRDHFDDEWDSDYENAICVHGHTSIFYFNDYFYDYKPQTKLGSYWYCDGHKVNIDCGSAFTGYTVLLNLDTFEDVIFYGEDFTDGKVK